MYDVRAYWISKFGEVLTVPKTHIDLVWDEPETFNLTKDYLRDTYKEYGEKFRFEGKAREFIMKKLIEEGWIRVRYTNHWIFEMWIFGNREKRNIKEFIHRRVMNSEMSIHDEVIITELSKNFNVNRMSSKELLEQRRMKK